MYCTVQLKRERTPSLGFKNVSIPLSKQHSWANNGGELSLMQRWERRGRRSTASHPSNLDDRRDAKGSQGISGIRVWLSVTNRDLVNWIVRNLVPLFDCYVRWNPAVSRFAFKRNASVWLVLTGVQISCHNRLCMQLVTLRSPETAGRYHPCLLAPRSLWWRWCINKLLLSS